MTALAAPFNQLAQLDTTPSKGLQLTSVYWVDPDMRVLLATGLKSKVYVCSP